MSTIAAGTTSTTALVNTGDTTGNLVFQTNGTTTAMTIDTSQRVGIGTSSPTYKLDIVDSAANAIFGLRVKTTGTNGFALLDLDSTASGADAYVRYLGAGVENARIVANSTSMNFMTGSGATERMRIDATTGNVGIGTTSPGTKLDVFSAGSAATETVLQITNPYTSGTAVASASLLFRYHSGASLRPAAKIDAGQATAGSFANGYLDFYVETGDAIPATPQVRIDSSGNLLVGKTAQSATTAGIELVPPAVGNSGITVTSAQSTNVYSGFQMYSTGAAAYRFYVTFDGKINATNTTIAGISDQRLKENIRDLDDGLNTVMALKPRKFDWKAGKGKDIKGDRGFIAQEFGQVFPDLIDEWKDPAPDGEEPYKAVRADLIPVLVKAIQEQQAMITQLQAEVAALKGAQ